VIRSFIVCPERPRIISQPSPKVTQGIPFLVAHFNDQVRDFVLTQGPVNVEHLRFPQIPLDVWYAPRSPVNRGVGQSL
jgi:hypothetical protein